MVQEGRFIEKVTDYLFWKRCFDAAGALIGLFSLLPLAGFLCVVILVSDGRPVFFRQGRIGLGGRTFSLYKFRTMRVVAKKEQSGRRELICGGRKLRELGLDELPQIWNVLRGQMSFIGPRPLLPAYTEFFTEEEKTRHAVRPGLTGLAQVKGRNHLSWEEKFQLDLEYVSNLSFRVDLRVLLLTIPALLRPDEAKPDGLAIDARLDSRRENKLPGNPG